MYIRENNIETTMQIKRVTIKTYNI